MAKKYIDAKMTIVHIGNDVIATSLGNGELGDREPSVDDDLNNFAPERRYRRTYRNDYGDSYGDNYRL